MKTYKSSDLTHKRAEVLKEAKVNGVIIKQLETNGETREEFLLVSKHLISRFNSGDSVCFDLVKELAWIY